MQLAPISTSLLVTLWIVTFSCMLVFLPILIGHQSPRITAPNHTFTPSSILTSLYVLHPRESKAYIRYVPLVNPVKLFVDQFRTPISLKDASDIIVNLASIDLSGEVINLGGLERVSRCELGEILCSLGGFDKNLIQKISMDDIPNFPKVEDVSLNIEKLQTLGFKPRTIEENISEILKDYQL